MSRRATDLSMGSLLWMALLRLPAFTEILLAFAVLVGGIGALLSLNRKSELIVMRAGGMSVWQFLRPGLVVALVLGIAAVTLYNPLAAAARSEAERLIAEAFGREASLLASLGRRLVAAAGRRRRTIGDERESHRRSGVVAGRRDRLSVRRARAVRRAHRCRPRQPRRRLLGAAQGAWFPAPVESRGLRDVYGKHLPDTGARQRGARLGDRGLHVAAAVVDRSG